MARFDEFMDGFSYDPENFDVEKFKADAASAYSDDKGAWDAKIEELTGSSTSAAEEVKALKLRNYDLLNKIPANKISEQNPEDKRKTIDDFFKRVEK